MNERHLSDQELNALIDIDAEERIGDVRYGHISGCERCRRRFRSLETVHSALASVPAAPLEELEVQRIMERVRSSRVESFAVPLVQRMAYFAAFLLVAGIVSAVFYSFDVIDVSKLQIPVAEAGGLFWDYYNAVAGGSERLLQPLSPFIERTLRDESTLVLSFTVILLLLLMLLDRWLFEHLLRSGH